MSADVKALREHLAPPSVERLPNQSVIDLLRDALRDAESGDVQAVAIVRIDRDGFGTIHFHANNRDDKAKLAGHIGRMSYQFTKAWDES